MFGLVRIKRRRLFIIMQYLIATGATKQKMARVGQNGENYIDKNYSNQESRYAYDPA
jgi:hypothetical protein